VFKRPNFKLIGVILLSLADEIVILSVVFIVLSLLGVDIPGWAIILSAAIMGVITYVCYILLRKQPQLGFDNMVGLTGVAVETIGRKGTVKIKGELWFASTKAEIIKIGTEVTVVEQTGLKLVVIPLEKVEKEIFENVLLPKNFGLTR
jgi:membrane protein implicated in regulation of membrane protease activity